MRPDLAERYQVPELDLLRIKVAHLEWHNAQLQASHLAQAREALIRQTLLASVTEEEIEQYVIDMERGVIRLREEPPA